MNIDKFNNLFFPHDSKSNHDKSIDGLRGIAVLIVLLSHSSNAGMFFHEALNFQKTGKVGVYLFFVLSAYLLDRQIALAFISKTNSIHYWKNYFLRRFLRIYPLFFVSLILHGLFTLLGVNTVISCIGDIFSHMLLIKGESVFWSIPVEFKYYFISPFLLWFFNSYFKWEKAKIIISILLLIICSIFIDSTCVLPKISTFKYLPIFLVGTFISIFEIISKVEKFEIRNSIFLNFAGIACVAIILITNPILFEYIFGLKLNFQASIFFLPYAILWAVILWAAKYGEGIVKYFLEIKFLRFIGSISFSIYLFHMLFLNLVKQSGVDLYLQIYLFLFMTIMFSCITFLLIERPFSKIRLTLKN